MTLLNLLEAEQCYPLKTQRLEKAPKMVILDPTSPPSLSVAFTSIPVKESFTEIERLDSQPSNIKICKVQ